MQAAQELLEAKRELTTIPEADMTNILLKTQRPYDLLQARTVSFSERELLINNDDFWVGRIT